MYGDRRPSSPPAGHDVGKLLRVERSEAGQGARAHGLGVCGGALRRQGLAGRGSEGTRTKARNRLPSTRPVELRRNTTCRAVSSLTEQRNKCPALGNTTRFHLPSREEVEERCRPRARAALPAETGPSSRTGKVLGDDRTDSEAAAGAAAARLSCNGTICQIMVAPQISSLDYPR